MGNRRYYAAQIRIEDYHKVNQRQSYSQRFHVEEVISMAKKAAKKPVKAAKKTVKLIKKKKK